jgi:murein DD-endopeptidase MepM/ murein hydrolase activator NlpD
MVADIPSRGARLLPEICVHFRTANGWSQILLPRAVQGAAFSAVLIVVIALCYLAIGRIGIHRIVAEKEAAVVRAETIHLGLRDEAARLHDRLDVAVRDRERAEARLFELTAQGDAEVAAANAVRIGQLTQALEGTQRELREAHAQRTALAVRLSKIDADQSLAGQRKGSIAATVKKLQQVSADRDKAASERDQLRIRVSELEQRDRRREILRSQRLSGPFHLAGLITTELVQTEGESPRPGVIITDALPEPARESRSAAELGRQLISEFARALASTGLNIDRLFPQLGLNRAEGGPFLPLPRGDHPASIGPDKLEAMRSLIRSLPLSTPLDYYQVESRFGRRHDPFNRRVSFHSGIDLSAPYTSPVYATAAGIVTYAGYRSDYGKVVEIDHGNGIATLYGHLHRYTVSVGQRVAEHTQIGLLGSSGRSSGPHVHYEILVNDEPQDPEKFIGLARLIPVSQERTSEADR